MPFYPKSPVEQELHARGWCNDAHALSEPPMQGAAMMVAALASPDLPLAQACFLQAKALGVDVEEAARLAVIHRKPAFLAWLAENQGLDVTRAAWRFIPEHLDTSDPELTWLKNANNEASTIYNEARRFPTDPKRQRVEATLRGMALCGGHLARDEPELLAVLFPDNATNGAPIKGRSELLPVAKEGVYPLALALEGANLKAADWLVTQLGWPATVQGKAQCLMAGLHGLMKLYSQPMDGRGKAHRQVQMQTLAGWVDDLMAQGASWTYTWAQRATHPHQTAEEAQEQGGAWFMANDTNSAWMTLVRSTLPPEQLGEGVIAHWAQTAAQEPTPNNPTWLQVMTSDVFSGRDLYRLLLNTALECAPHLPLKDSESLYRLALGRDLEDSTYSGLRFQALLHQPPPTLAPLTPEMAARVLQSVEHPLMHWRTHGQKHDPAAQKLWVQVERWCRAWAPSVPLSPESAADSFDEPAPAEAAVALDPEWARQIQALHSAFKASGTKEDTETLDGAFVLQLALLNTVSDTAHRSRPRL